MRVIQHLPWRDRLRVEAVNSRWRQTAITRGWTHVRHFSNADYAPRNRPNDRLGLVNDEQLSHLLDRCSTHLESIQLTLPLTINWHPGVENLLDRCSNVRRIAIRAGQRGESITEDIVNYLRERCRRSDRARLR